MQGDFPKNNEGFKPKHNISGTLYRLFHVSFACAIYNRKGDNSLFLTDMGIGTTIVDGIDIQQLKIEHTLLFIYLFI